jgi:hypothetical protein
MKIEYSMPPRCYMCQADAAECYPPDNDKRYSGLCKDCFHIFYEKNTHLFPYRQSEKLKVIKQCQHESDGCCYYKSGIKSTDFLAYVSSEIPGYLKCKKCGEFYR